MNCANPHCGKPNPDDGKFCSACGYPLQPDLRSVIKAVLTSEFKDRELVEVTTAHAIAERVSHWAKLMGWFVGAPVLILGAILSLVGISQGQRHQRCG